MKVNALVVEVDCSSPSASPRMQRPANSMAGSLPAGTQSVCSSPVSAHNGEVWEPPSLQCEGISLAFKSGASDGAVEPGSHDAHVVIVSKPSTLATVGCTRPHLKNPEDGQAGALEGSEPSLGLHELPGAPGVGQQPGANEQVTTRCGAEDCPASQPDQAALDRPIYMAAAGLRVEVDEREGDNKDLGGGPATIGTGRCLAESTLYKEDVLEGGHCQVWGSWFDTVSQHWGYACCQTSIRSSCCTATPKVETTRFHPSAAHQRETPLTTGVTDLSPRACFLEAADFITHWVRAVLHDWRQALQCADPRIAAHPHFGAWEHLSEAERAAAPLLRLLEACSSSYTAGEAVHVWSVGHNRWMRDGKVLEVLAADTVVGASRTPADGALLLAGSVLVSFSAGDARKWVAPDQTTSLLRKAPQVELNKDSVEKLERISVLAMDREYHAANQAYIELTVGHGRWHEDLSVKGLTGCNKAPRGGFKVKKDQSNFLDTEEAKDYMFCMKRLVTFQQLTRPNPDLSKHFT